MGHGEAFDFDPERVRSHGKVLSKKTGMNDFGLNSIPRSVCGEKTLGGKGGSRETSEEPQAMVEVTGDGDLDYGARGSDSGGI